MGSHHDVANNVSMIVVKFMKKFLQKKYREDKEALREMEDVLAHKIAKEIEPYCGP